MQYFWFGVTILFLIGLIGSGYVFRSWKSHRSPGRPYSYADCLAGDLPQDSTRVVVLGDSLTHGTMSHNWLVDLQLKYGDQISFVNQGWNGDLAWNALQKIDQVIACEPDVVAVFVGANDVLASFSPEWSQRFVIDKQLPQSPSADWYRQNLEAIIINLQAETDARLVLFTLTSFGEDANSAEFKKFDEYSQIVEETGHLFQIPVLPIHSKYRTFLLDQPDLVAHRCSPAELSAYRSQIRRSIIRHHFFLQSWDQISESRGYVAQTDCAHLNSKAAGIIGDAFSNWLDQIENLG